MTDQITTWRALAGEMKLAGENQERVRCVSGVAYFPRFYRAEAAQEVAAALRAACGRIEALEGVVERAAGIVESDVCDGPECKALRCDTMRAYCDEAKAMRIRALASRPAPTPPEGA